MRLMNSEKLDYIKQPHIMALIFICIAVVIGIAYTSIKRINDINRLESIGTESACLEFIDDTDLCRFIAKSEQDEQKNYIMIGKSETPEGTEITTVEVESPDRMKSVTKDTSGEIDSYVVIDDVSYVKDYSDNVWAMYTDPEYQPTEIEAQKYDFTKATSEDVNEFKNNYKRVGSEQCGEVTCLKYEITSSEGTLSFLWFDTNEYKLRRYLTAADESTIDTEFMYQDVSISPPSPTKEVTEEEIQEYL